MLNKHGVSLKFWRVRQNFTQEGKDYFLFFLFCIIVISVTTLTLWYFRPRNLLGDMGIEDIQRIGYMEIRTSVKFTEDDPLYHRMFEIPSVPLFNHFRMLYPDTRMAPGAILLDSETKSEIMYLLSNVRVVRDLPLLRALQSRLGIVDRFWTIMLPQVVHIHLYKDIEVPPIEVSPAGGFNPLALATVRHDLIFHYNETFTTGGSSAFVNGELHLERRIYRIHTGSSYLQRITELLEVLIDAQKARWIAEYSVDTKIVSTGHVTRIRCGIHRNAPLSVA